MAFALALLVPNAVAGLVMQAGRSGKSYTADAYGVLKNVTPQDAVDLQTGGAINLGQQQALNNFAATIAPTVHNDLTQDYAVGSRWLVISAQKEYICFNAALGAAVWATLD